MKEVKGLNFSYLEGTKAKPNRMNRKSILTTPNAFSISIIT